MKFTASRLVLAGLALPLVIATAAIAQPAPPPRGDAAGAPDRPWRDPAARAAKHAQHLRDSLQLRADQEGALQAFLASHKRPDGERGKWREERRDGAGMSAPERADRRLAHIDQMRARMVEHATAVKRFYAQLSPSQQKAFDAMPMGRGHGMGHRGMRHGGRGGGHWGHGPGGPGMDGPGAPGED